MRNVKTGFHILCLKFFFLKKKQVSFMPRGQKDEGISLQDRVIEVMTYFSCDFSNICKEKSL